MRTYEQGCDREQHAIMSIGCDKVCDLTSALFALLVVGLTGCMMGPNDGQVVASKSEPIYFQGYSIYPNDPVQVEVFNGAIWLPIANTISDSTSWTKSDGTDLFHW